MKKIVGFLIGLIVVAVVYLSYSTAPLFVTKSMVRSIDKLVITGHRGAAGLAPENTIPSVKKALEIGVERIEIDVQQTKDSVVIVLHDTTVDRTTDGTGTVRKMLYKDIEALDAGSWYGQEFSGVKVPTLEQVIKAVKGKAELVIEIKQGNHFYPGIEARVVALIHENKMVESCIVHSFYDEVLFKIHEKDKTIRLHKLFIAHSPFFYYDGNGFQFNSLEKYAFAEEFSIMHQFASTRFIKQAHDMGKKVNVWTIKSEKKGNKYLRLGVDGLITDYPNYFK